MPYLDQFGNHIPSTQTIGLGNATASRGLAGVPAPSRPPDFSTPYAPPQQGGYRPPSAPSYSPPSSTGGTWGGLMGQPYPQNPSTPNAPNTIGLKDRGDRNPSRTPAPPPPAAPTGPPLHPSVSNPNLLGTNIQNATPTGTAPPPKTELNQPTPPKPTMGTPTPAQPNEPTLGQNVLPKPAGFEGVPDAVWNDAQRWVSDAKAQGADYSFLLQHPDLIMQYREFVGADESGARGGIDFTDWLQHIHPDEFNNPLAGRRGFDTFLYSDANKTLRGYGQGTNSGTSMWDQNAANAKYQKWLEIMTDLSDRHLDPNDPKNWPGGRIFDQHGTDVTPAAPATTPHGTTPPATTPGTTPPATTPASQPPESTPQGGGGQGGGGGVGAQGGPSIADQLKALLGPQFGYEQEQLNRGLNANAALSGDINSGGFGETVGRAQSQLAANQGSRLSDYLTTASENAANRGVQYAQIDAQKFIASMQDETTRLGITTNDQLQRWLNDPNNNTLNKYQIDKQDLWQRYQAQLQLQGQTLQANAQINAASMQAAATASAAAQNAKSQLAIAQIQAQTAAHGQQNQYDLGVLGINRDIYNTDINDRYRQMYLQWLMSMQGAFSGQPPNLPDPFPYGG